MTNVELSGTHALQDVDSQNEKTREKRITLPNSQLKRNGFPRARGAIDKNLSLARSEHGLDPFNLTIVLILVNDDFKEAVTKKCIKGFFKIQLQNNHWQLPLDI